jgi:serine/threonine-protein kinase
MTEPRRLLERYEVLEEIARGGMAIVHMARLVGPAGFCKNVAVKRLHAQYARDPEFVAMFLDEARLAARIHHPNVVQTLDVAMSEGELFVMMEYIDGASLAQLARGFEEGVAPPIAVAIMASVCSGLHAAHEARGSKGEPLEIVHRDVSPQNVLVGRDGVPRVLDFGIAKAVSRSRTTQAGEIKGKLPYMSPEQLRAESVDRRTDVYAAGVVLWELCAGRALFHADDPGGIVGKVLVGKVEPPSQYNPAVPPALDAVVLRALDRDRDARFATAHDLAVALEEAVAPATVRAVAAWVGERAKKALAANAALLERIEAATLRTAPAPRPEEEIERRRDLEQGTARSVITSMPPEVTGSASSARRVATIAVVIAVAGAAAAAIALRDRDMPQVARAFGPFDVSAPAVAAPSVLPVASAAASAEPSASVSIKAPVTAPLGAQPRGNCTPPHTIGKDGVKRFKPWCL